MWENIKTEIYLWYIRTFKTRHCKVPEGWTSITMTDDEVHDDSTKQCD